jgi:dihydrofolate reductase
MPASMSQVNCPFNKLAATSVAAGLIASFLDEGAIDEFIISVIPTFIGEGTPLIAPRHREVPLRLLSVQRFSDGVVQLHCHLRQTAG